MIDYLFGGFYVPSASVRASACACILIARCAFFKKKAYYRNYQNYNIQYVYLNHTQNY